jgi:hypothetical protein
VDRLVAGADSPPGRCLTAPGTGWAGAEVYGCSGPSGAPLGPEHDARERDPRVMRGVQPGRPRGFACAGATAKYSHIIHYISTIDLCQIATEPPHTKGERSSRS